MNKAQVGDTIKVSDDKNIKKDYRGIVTEVIETTDNYVVIKPTIIRAVVLHEDYEVVNEDI